MLGREVLDDDDDDEGRYTGIIGVPASCRRSSRGAAVAGEGINFPSSGALLANELEGRIALSPLTLC